jgi:hypothetical protein
MLTSRLIPSNPSLWHRSRPPNATAVDFQCLRSPKYRYASLRISMLSHAAYTSCSVYRFRFVRTLDLAPPPAAVAEEGWVPPAASSISTTPRCSRSMDGSQSATVSNFSRASFINTKVAVRLALARDSIDDASLAGDVRLSSCSARFVSRSQARKASPVVASILRTDCDNTSVRRWHACSEASIDMI